MLHVTTPTTEAELEEVFELRWRILRKPWGQTRGSEQDEFDRNADHVAVRDETGQLLGIGRLHLSATDEAQIRYMATPETSRGRGVGKRVIEQLESLARQHRVSRIVLNARTPVVGFYEGLGYIVTGPGPTLFGEIEHMRMEKVLADPRSRGEDAAL